uniref:Ubiquitin-like domain-containing protein n=1 Tax=Trichogramma kaykai TaxID=54128 RepID=A0ABD2X4L5_9HYME
MEIYACIGRKIVERWHLYVRVVIYTVSTGTLTFCFRFDDRFLYARCYVQDKHRCVELYSDWHDETVKELKEYIEGEEDVAVDRQRIIFNGKQLENERTLQDYNIQDESTVQLVLRIEGGPCTECTFGMAHNFAKDLLKVDARNVETTQLKSMADRALLVAQRLEILHKYYKKNDEDKIKRQLKRQLKETRQSK